MPFDGFSQAPQTLCLRFAQLILPSGKKRLAVSLPMKIRRPDIREQKALDKPVFGVEQLPRPPR
jgi:hypothetical protein